MWNNDDDDEDNNEGNNDNNNSNTNNNDNNSEKTAQIKQNIIIKNKYLFAKKKCINIFVLVFVLLFAHLKKFSGPL